MTNLSLMALAAASLSATAAFADATTPMTLTYDQFEATIAHVDLEQCGEAAKADTFCRLVVANDAFHVFVFAESGDMPLLGIQSYSADGIVSLLGPQTAALAQ